MNFDSIERIDDLQEDGERQFLFWILLKNPEPKIEKIAREIEEEHNDDYNERNFMLAVNYDILSKEFMITIPLFYIDSDDNENYIDYEISESLFNELKEECLKTFSKLELIKYNIKHKMNQK